MQNKVIKDSIANREADRKFDKWRERVRKKLPELSIRVFSLRCKGYMGSGFGWSLEKDLGHVIRSISNFDSYPDWMEQTIIETVTSRLYKDLARIENELTNKGN